MSLLMTCSGRFLRLLDFHDYPIHGGAFRIPSMRLGVLGAFHAENTIGRFLAAKWSRLVVSHFHASGYGFLEGFLALVISDSLNKKENLTSTLYLIINICKSKHDFIYMP
jgi:hypothetical protein